MLILAAVQRGLLREGVPRSLSVFCHALLPCVLYNVLLLMVGIMPACQQHATEPGLRPTVAHLARGKNTFTLSLESTDLSRSILVKPENLRVADNAGAAYAVVLSVRPIEDQVNKLILPREKTQIRYVLDRSIPDSVTSLTFTLEHLEAQEGTGSGTFALPSLQWTERLTALEQSAAAVDSDPATIVPSSEDDPDSLLVLQIDNLRRGCRRFDLIIENKAKDRTFTVGILDKVLISDNMGNPYHVDQFNIPDSMHSFQRTVAPQAFIRVPIVVADPIAKKSQEVQFYFESISAMLDSGTSYSLRPRQWTEQPRDATRSEVAEDQKIPPSIDRQKAQMRREAEEHFKRVDNFIKKMEQGKRESAAKKAEALR